MVHHVIVLGVLMIVHGALSVLCGIGAGAMAFIFPAMMKAQAGMPPGPGVPPPPMPPQLEWVVIAIYGGAGLVLLTTGTLGLWAGIQVMKFRGHTLGIIALSAGLLTILSCYCFPTSIALFIYGLIVLLNPPVKQAFEMGQQGYSADDVRTHFSRLPH